MPAAQTPRPRRYVRWIVAVIVLILIILALRFIVFRAPSAKMSTDATMQELVIPNAPAPVATDYAAAQQAFQYLVSYTDAGFSPASLRIKQGETVRFTNNSATTLTLIVAIAAPQSVPHGAYYQYTANSSGNFTYSDGKTPGSLVVAP